MGSLVLTSQSKAQPARVWAFVGIILLISVWFIWQWHRLDSTLIVDNLQTPVSLPNTVASGLFLPHATPTPSWLARLTTPDIEKRERLFLLSTAGEWSEAGTDNTIAFPRPFGWFLPYTNSIAFTSSSSGFIARRAWTTHDSVHVPTLTVSQAIKAPIPPNATSGWREGSMDVFFKENAPVPWQLFVAELAQKHQLITLAESILRESSTRTQKKTLPDGSIMQEIVRDPIQSIRREFIVSDIIAKVQILRLFSDQQDWFLAQTDSIIVLGNSLESIEKYLSTHVWTNTVCSLRVQAFKKHDFGLSLDSKQLSLAQSYTGFTLCTE